MSDEREAAWDAVHETLPALWRVGPVTYDPGVLRSDGHVGAFSVTARGPHPGRGKVPVTVSGIGVDETAALCDLDDRLRGVPKPDGTLLDELRRRLRLAYVDGAEEWSGKTAGEPSGGRARTGYRAIRRPIARLSRSGYPATSHCSSQSLLWPRITTRL